jgi:hypothetical protein
LQTQRRGDVEHLVESFGADDSRLVKQRIDGNVARGQGSGVGAGSPAPRSGSSRLDRDDRLVAADAVGDARESARIAEGFQVEKNDAGVLVLLPKLQHIVAGDIRLVADADEARKAQLPFARQ